MPPTPSVVSAKSISPTSTPPCRRCCRACNWATSSSVVLARFVGLQRHKSLALLLSQVVHGPVCRIGNAVDSVQGLLMFLNVVLQLRQLVRQFLVLASNEERGHRGF